MLINNVLYGGVSDVKLSADYNYKKRVTGVKAVKLPELEPSNLYFSEAYARHWYWK